jgi:hypothetical protein
MIVRLPDDPNQVRETGKEAGGGRTQPSVNGPQPDARTAKSMRVFVVGRDVIGQSGLAGWRDRMSCKGQQHEQAAHAH